MLNRKAVIDQMNLLAQDKVPFIFFTDFLGSQGYVRALNELPKDVLFDFEGFSNYQGRATYPMSLTTENLGFDRYSDVFSRVQKEIRLGNSYLVNLTFQTLLKNSVNYLNVFKSCCAKYKFLFQDQFVCFSPETFVKISEKGIISSHPMKGTIDGAIPDAINKILANQKEIAEHTTIVDLIRNDLSEVANNISVPRFRYVEEIQTNNKKLLQVSSEIQGQLPRGWQKNIGDIIFKLLPAGSICGAPKTKTVQIILENENYDRGFYSGICGLFDGNGLNSGVMIRFIDRQNTHSFYKSGGGITASSDPMVEYQELLDKIYVPIY